MTPMATLGIAIRLWLWAAALRPLKHVLPLDALVRLAHTSRRTRGGRRREFERVLERYLASQARFPRRAPGNCLERSLGAYRMLCTVNADPTLIVGLKRTASGLIGHVWVLVDGRALAERPEDVSMYTPVVAFDSSARQRAFGGSPAMPVGIRFA